MSIKIKLFTTEHLKSSCRFPAALTPHFGKYRLPNPLRIAEQAGIKRLTDLECIENCYSKDDIDHRHSFPPTFLPLLHFVLMEADCLL